MAAPRARAAVERWPIARPFAISRGAKTVAEVAVATIDDGDCEGRGECVPYARYGETAAGVAGVIDAFDGPFDRQALIGAMPAGAARNAIDCALWDLESRRAGKPVWELAGVSRPRPVVSAYTLSLDSPTAMGARAAAERHRPLLKLKLGSPDVADDVACLAAVREAAPETRLIVDANEGWDEGALERFLPAALAARVELIEQPLAQGADAALAELRSPVPIAADESVRDGAELGAELEEIAARYQLVNVKLDKTGGLTRALALVDETRKLGLDIMVGCMVATSLAIAPALLLLAAARYADLDGPLLLARDRKPGLACRDGRVALEPGVWGFAPAVA